MIKKLGFRMSFPLEAFPNSTHVPRLSHKEPVAPIEDQHVDYLRVKKEWIDARSLMEALESAYPWWVMPDGGYEWDPGYIRPFVPRTVTVFDETEREYFARTTPEERRLPGIWGAFAPASVNLP